jgi:hypothetical protein
MKKFKQALRKDLKVRRTGLLGLGRTVEVSGGGLTYRVDRRRANAETAAIINSKIPTMTIDRTGLGRGNH